MQHDAMRHDCTPLRFGVLRKGATRALEHLVVREVDIRNGGRYAGLGAEDYLSLAHHSGGMVLTSHRSDLDSFENEHPLAHNGERAFIPLPRRRGKHTVLPFPIVDFGVQNRGLQCLGHLLQLVVALMQVSAQGPPLEIVIPFPDDNLPSDHLVHLLGLCDALPDQSNSAYGYATGNAHPYRIQPAMLPGIVGALLNRDWLGKAFVETSGLNGGARVHFPYRRSPFSLNQLPLLQQIAAGRLSVIGLPDIPLTRFGA